MNRKKETKRLKEDIKGIKRTLKTYWLFLPKRTVSKFNNAIEVRQKRLEVLQN